MTIHGIVHQAALQEYPPGSERIELVISAQGVGPNMPRQFVVPYEALLGDASLDPDQIVGRGFEAEVEQDPEGRWIVARIGFASRRVLRDEGG